VLKKLKQKCQIDSYENITLIYYKISMITEEQFQPDSVDKTEIFVAVFKAL
jgi:hypothetical protein